MIRKERLDYLNEYVARTKEILELSSPQLKGIVDAEDYRVHLQESFKRIGELARENNSTLNKYFLPLVSDESIPDKEDIELMREFGALLSDTTTMEGIDLPLLYLQARSISRSAKESGDIRAEIIALDSMIIASYMMLNMTIRLYPEVDTCFKYRDEGLDAAYRILEFLDRDKFADLPDDECRELVLINSRYMRCLFEWDDKEYKTWYNAENMRLMKQSLSLADDPFYTELMPNYRWDVHVFRTLQYIADSTEYNNIHELNDEQLEEVYQATMQLVDLLKEKPELEEGCPDLEQRFYVLSNSYLTGRISREEQHAGLIEILNERDENDFSSRAMFLSFVASFSFILTLDKDDISPQEEETLKQIYESIAVYAYRMPKTGVFSFMITFLVDILKNYVEVPGGITFREMCLKLIAAMHPPTYVHTLNVAELSRYLTERLIDRDPRRLVGTFGTTTVKAVRAKREEILDFAYNSALMHDVGKIFIVETIMTYGRSLIDSEIKIIRAHNKVGAALLSLYDDTKEYAEIALGHHLWYDDSRGYPEGEDSSKWKYKPIVSIVEVADCLDAATDSIGRSYKSGKKLDEFIDELREGRGTRYAPYVVDLFESASLREELEQKLTGWRDDNYRNTYQILKTLSVSRMDFTRYDQSIQDLISECERLSAEIDDKAISKLEELEEIANEKNDHLLLGFVYFHKANYYYDTSVYDSFQDSIENALHHLLRCNAHELLARAYNFFAIDAQANDAYDIAYSYYMTALRFTDAEVSPFVTGVVLHNLATFHYEIADYGIAREYFRRASRLINKDSNDPYYVRNMIVSQLSEASTSIGTGDLESAKRALKKIKSLLVRYGEEQQTDSILVYHYLMIRIDIIEGRGIADFDEKIDKIVEMIKENASSFVEMAEVRDFCNCLMEYGYMDAVKKIISAASLYVEEFDIAHMTRVLNDIKIEYYSIVNDEDNLIETLKMQNAVFKRQKYEQKRIYLNSMKLIELVGKLHDEKSAMRLENEHLFIQARTDQLTGLPNRFALDQKLSQLFESAYRNSRKLGVGILDIDDFKQYNDDFGHQVGDDCLEKIGEVLKSFGDKDGIYCARYGGDEFVIIFENKNDDEIEEIAKRMYDAVRRNSVSSIKDGERSYLTVSQGVCNDIPRMKSKVWDFLSAADKAMYSVKHDKKKIVEIVNLPEFD